MASSFLTRNFYNAYYRNQSTNYKEVKQMDNVWKIVKIVSGITVVVIGTYKIVKERRDSAKETKEGVE